MQSIIPYYFSECPFENCRSKGGKKRSSFKNKYILHDHLLQCHQAELDMEVGWRRRLFSDEIPDGNYYDIFDPELEDKEDTGEIDGLKLAMESFHF